MTEKSAADWRSILLFIALVAFLFMAWLLHAWDYASHFAFEKPGPEAIAIGFALILVAVCLTRIAKDTRAGVAPPNRLLVRLFGPLGLVGENIGYSISLYTCLRGLRFVATTGPEVEFLDQLAVILALLGLLFWSVWHPLKDVKSVFMTSKASLAPATPQN